MEKEEGKEGRRIRGIIDLLNKFPANSLSGLEASIGMAALDDCAVVPLDHERDLVVGSDFVRGEDFHLFRRGYLSKSDLGYYLVGANVSDLAAMGASPLGIVVVARYSPEMTDEDFLEIMAGVCQACSEFSIPLLGGDSGSYPVSVLSAAAIGICPRGRALLRSGGHPGDILFVTGEVGEAGAALTYFCQVPPEERNLGEEAERQLLDRWRRVAPALQQGRVLAELGLSKCAIDTSDGLKVACEQLAEASGVDLIVKPETIPISGLTRKVAGIVGCESVELALSGSVDFRLVFSASLANAHQVKGLFNERGWQLFEIGRLAEPQDRPRAYLETGHGLEPLPGTGWIQ